MKRQTQKRLGIAHSLATYKEERARKNRKKPEPIHKTLFDFEPVSQAEIDAWLLAVPRIDPSSPRARNYVKFYGVADKIAAAKAKGTFFATINPQPGLTL